MPTWNTRIPRFEVFHGTDDLSLGLTGLSPGQSLPGFLPNLSLCRPHTEFGQGFYVTTSDHQARQWANARWVRSPAGGTNAVVLKFVLHRDALAKMEQLVFVRPTADFWDLVVDCRHGFPPHQRPAVSVPYDIVYGPVTIWPSRLLIQDCDQISFHTGRASALLSNPTVYEVGNPML
jgi:hypothetical protein